MKHIPCHDCGTPVPYDTRKRSIYCSRACRQKAYRKRRRLARAKSDSAVKRFCVNCGKSFVTLKRVQKFCSTSCRSSFWQQQKRLETRLERKYAK